MSDKKREQRIKGVLAHELCHYVTRLVFENQENPYYKHVLKETEMFEKIVKTIDKWSTEDAECPDDKCNRIISSVFTAYEQSDFHPELIVRVTDFGIARIWNPDNSKETSGTPGYMAPEVMCR